MRENRLAKETSPYLLQHARNPVDWYPWGQEALARARDEDRPILLSIGYSACHWCHVMERESFEDEATAGEMNRDFVCVKVDREERPDLDDIYMKATVTLNRGQGGWPMTVFLTPDGRPFFAGTYFPPRDNYGRPSFRTVLAGVITAWRERREKVLEQAGHLTEHLEAEAMASAPAELDGKAIEAAVGQYAGEFDARFGGFGHAPKFPPSTGLQLLLRAHRRFGSAEALAMVRGTLDGMAKGGMYDQIGGGFSRYSTDERWLVPHFEKMLYDNALLARAYLEGFQATGDPLYRKIAREIFDYELREMQSPEGGFYSSTDADSEGVEGKFFVWQPSDVKAILGEEEGRRLCAWFDITPEGNFEGQGIPNTPREEAVVALELGISVEALRGSVDAGKAKLYAARERRVHPGRDDKVLTAWNGMMLGALSEGARVLGEPRYLDSARRAADFLLQTMRRPEGGLYRTYRKGAGEGKAHLDAYLEDYAWLAEALIDLYEAGADRSYLDEAARLLARLRADFTDPRDGAFFTTAKDHERLIVRQRDALDGATPSGNAVAGCALVRLSYHLDDPAMREAGRRALTAFGAIAVRHPRACARGLQAIDLLIDGPVELAFVGPANDPARIALERAVAAVYLPNRIIAHSERGDGAGPLLSGKTLVDGKSALYICRNYSCQAPITEPAAVAAALGR